MQTSRDIFSTVHSEGALLPPSLLRRIAEGDQGVGGLTPGDYHLVGEKTNEAVNRAWNRALAAWKSFREASSRLPESDVGTSVTRERWLLVLFNELGYGRLQGAKSLDVSGRNYPVSHLWHRTPIHLVGFRVGLDRRTPGVAGASRVSPHGLVQDLLNRSDEHLWGILSNGRKLRLLRDSASLVRQAYVEFDLESMMEGQVFPDFVLFWLLCHQSRIEAEQPADCWLERWTKVADEQGTRALDHLRDGVETAIQALGQGFLQHRANRQLLERLRSGELSTQDYYRQLLRMVYRLIFLFVAEDRDFLFAPGTPEEAKIRYREHYSTARLRALADKRRGSRHVDLWRGLRLVFGMLTDDAGCPELGLPALNSFLWSLDATANLIASDIQNADLLEAVRSLSFTTENGARRAVDFRNLGPEELGSIYESLLELHPDVNVDAGAFALATVGGSERKTTGSYYTPDALIQHLLDTALDPVIERAVRGPNPENAILALKVVDPACGSGHFLIAASHRIAKRLAAVRTGEDEPPPEAVRRSLRDVIGRCIFGVDINPMAVELCKVGLWMEALEPGKPLSFLDHHVQVGNGLWGATPALLGSSLPDVAFAELDGDDKTIATETRRRNKAERERETLSLFSAGLAPWSDADAVANQITALSSIDDSNIAGVRKKQRAFEGALQSEEYQRAKLLADAWCAAFAWPLVRGAATPITSEAFYRLRTDTNALTTAQRVELDRLINHYRFLHWHLAFPEVFRVARADEASEATTGWVGGFDVVLGNPPWDTLSPDAKEFFAVYDPAVRFMKKDEQQQRMDEMLTDSGIAEKWRRYRRDLFASVSYYKNSGAFRLFASGNLGKGDFDLFRLFVERALQLTADGGFAAQVVKSGIYSGSNCQAIRKEIFERWTLRGMYGFVNTGKRWFPGIHAETRFAIYAAQRGGSTSAFPAAFGLDSAEALAAASRAPHMVSVDTVAAQSPVALAIPETSGAAGSEVSSRMYACHPAFGDATAGPPTRRYQAEIHMGNDRDRFNDKEAGLPLYEGRMIDQFDHRAKGYRSGRGRSAIWEELPFGADNKEIVPQWRVPTAMVPAKARERVERYRVAWCDVATPTAPRSLVAALLPPGVVAGHKAPTITFSSGFEWAFMPWLAVANSICMDFLARQKVSLSMTITLMDSLPFPRPRLEDEATKLLGRLALRLTCTSREMNGYWNAMARYGWCEPIAEDGAAPGYLDPDTRALALAAIDAIVARDVFSLSRADLEFVLDSFEKVAKAETKAFGEYRSRRLILEFYDELQRGELGRVRALAGMTETSGAAALASTPVLAG